jgi:16S rRNA (guanine(966)-N(2))-methyltransferase RsmD
MRILSGDFKGKTILAGKDLSIRPATNRIKEVIFAVLDEFCDGKNVLDLFSGSGSLGLEALSRGAKSITFVELDNTALHVLTKNIDQFRNIKHKISVIHSDALSYLESRAAVFDLILMDPPFRYPHLQQITERIFKNNFLEKQGVLVVHHEVNNPLLKSGTIYQFYKQKKVGRSLVSFIIQENFDVE